MGCELFQDIEETRCGMFESKLRAERKVSFERGGIDTSKACHIARRNVRSRAAGSGRTGSEAGELEKLSRQCCFESCKSNKRSATRPRERFRGWCQATQLLFLSAP